MSESVQPEQRNCLERANGPQQTSQQMPATVKQHAETTELIKQNLALRSQNMRLSNQLEQLTEKLKVQLSTGVASPTHQQLANSMHLISTYRKQISFLKGRLTENPESQLQDMQTILKGKDAEIEMLKREVAELKKNSDKKQKSLVDVESGERRYEALYERLLQEYQRGKRRCEQYQKLMKRRNPMPRIVEVHANQHTSCIAKYEKEIEALKSAELRNKKTCRHLNWELQKLKQQNQQLNERLKEKQRQVFESEGKFLRYKKQAKGKNYQSLDFHHRSVTVPNQEGICEHFERSTMERQNTLPSLYDKAIYPRIQYTGKSFSSGKVWNDLKLSSKILGVRVSLNSDETIGRIDCIYKKGQTRRISIDSQNVLQYNCENGQFIQTIQGAFDGQFLSYLIFGTNLGKSVRFGFESDEATQFDFKISAFQCPVSLFGEQVHFDSQRKINKFGCLIERLN